MGRLNIQRNSRERVVLIHRTTGERIEFWPKNIRGNRDPNLASVNIVIDAPYVWQVSRAGPTEAPEEPRHGIDAHPRT